MRGGEKEYVQPESSGKEGKDIPFSCPMRIPNR